MKVFLAKIPELPVQKIIKEWHENIALCQTSHEVLMCKAVMGKEIRDKLQNIKKYRPLTIYEARMAILLGV